MAFRWTHDGQTLISRCTLCPFVLASRLDRDILVGQRSHDPFTCQQRRLEAARALYAASPEGQAAARKLHVYELRNARHRELYAARHGAESRCGTTVLSTAAGVETGRMESAKTNRPTRERRTVLSTPSAVQRKGGC